MSPRQWFMQCGLGTCVAVRATAERYRLSIRATIAIVFMLLASCGLPADFTVQYGWESFGVVDDGIQDALDDCSAQWPVNEEIGNRLDLFSRTREQIDLPQYCGPTGAAESQVCTMWIGWTEFPAMRARVYVREDISPAAAIRHECQHWQQWDRTDADAVGHGCARHTPDCWDYDLPRGDP